MYTVNPPLPIVGSDTDWNDTLRVPHLFKYLPTVVDVINPSTVQAPLTNQTFKNTQLATVVDPIVWKNDVPKLRQSNKCPANVLSSVFCVAIRKSNQRSTCCCCCKPVQDTLMQMTTEGESQAFTSRQIAPVKHLMIIDWDARDLINARLQWPHQLTLSVVDFRPNPQDLWIPPFVLLSNTWDCNCLCLWLRFRNCRPDCSCLCNCRPNCSCLYNCRPNHNSLCYCRTAWGRWRRCWGLCCLKFHRWRSTRSRFGWWIHWLLWSRWRHTWTNLRWWICWFLWNGCRWRMYWFFRNGCRWRMFWLFRNCYRGWYRITLPSEARIPSQPLAKKTAWIYWQLRRNHESTLISSSLSKTWRKKGSPKGFSVSSCGSPSDGGSEKTIVSTSDTLSIETSSSWFSRKYSSSLGKTICLLSGQPRSRNCNLSLTWCSLCTNCLRPAAPGSRSVRRRTMYSRRISSKWRWIALGLFFAWIPPRCVLLFPKWASKTPCKRLDNGDRERSRGSGGAGGRRMHEAATTLTNSFGQLDEIELRKYESVQSYPRITYLLLCKSTRISAKFRTGI